MDMAVALKEKRIDLRVPLETKKTIEEAAKLANLSLSSYILTITLKQAKLDLEQNEVITLSNVERDRLLSSLDKPAQPNEALKELFK